jgi:hypothetical protein
MPLLPSSVAATGAANLAFIIVADSSTANLAAITPAGVFAASLRSLSIALMHAYRLPRHFASVYFVLRSQPSLNWLYDAINGILHIFSVTAYNHDVMVHFL